MPLLLLYKRYDPSFVCVFCAVRGIRPENYGLRCWACYIRILQGTCAAPKFRGSNIICTTLLLRVSYIGHLSIMAKRAQTNEEYEEPHGIWARLSSTTAVYIDYSKRSIQQAAAVLYSCAAAAAEEAE